MPLFGGTTTGALTTTLAEDLDNSETGVDVADETGITTDNDVILVGEDINDRYNSRHN